MAYHYELTEEAAAEIDHAILHFETQFSSGAADFLTAYDDAIDRILKMPGAGPRRSEKDPDIRGRQIKAEKRRNSYAKSFPYMLIYKVYEENEKIVIFQLWPIRSNIPVREGPKEI